MRLVKYIGVIAMWVSMLWGIYTPERPQWLRDRLNSLPRLEHRHVSHVGNRSYFVETGNLRSWNRILENVIPGSPENMAREFLSRHSAEFGFPDDLHDIELKRWRETIVRTPHDGYRVEFIQKINEIPVYNSDIGVIVTKDGQVVSAFSNYYPNIYLDSYTPQVSNDNALSSAINFLQAQGVKNGDVQLMILAYPKARLVHRVRFTSTSPSGHWEVLVDAITGEILHVIDKRKYFNGRGYVFMPDPVTSAHTHYGQDGFIDNNDQNSDQLQAQLQTVILRDLDRVLIIIGEDTLYVYTLSGPYVRILDIEPPPEPDYTSENGEFYFDRSQMGFEAVMSYYHIDNFARYVAEMGYTSPFVYVDPHIDDSGAWYFADSIILGTVDVDAGEDAGVLIHEYTHAIQDAFMNGFDYSNDESAALSEGYADYMGGSYAYSLNAFNSDTVVKWGLHPHFNGRPLNSPKHYPDDFMNGGNPHENGEIWSACLWQIFHNLGRSVTDQLVLYSLDRLWPSAEFCDAAKEVLNADYWIFRGRDMDFIRSVFYNRGILHPPSVRVIFPEGNVKFVSGSIEQIQWQIVDIDNLTDHVRLYYRVNNGPWIEIGNVFPSFTTYHWLIPPNTGMAQIKVELVDIGNNVLASAVSDYFYIVPPPELTIVYPDEGDTITAGTQIEIQWTYLDPDNVIASLDILFSSDGGNNWETIAYHIQNVGHYTWIVPQVYTNRARMLIRTFNIRGVVVKIDTTDGYFTILIPPHVTLIWPDSEGIEVEEADTYAIRYNGDAAASIKKVRALFSYNGGQTWPDTIGIRCYNPTNLPTHVENDSILWVVTQHPTEHGRVKVVLYDAANQTAVDISSYDITVKLARPGNLTASVSSDLESITLTWTDRSNYEDGYIIERKDPYHDWSVIDTLPANEESYVDNSVEPYREYLYRIYAFASSEISSESVTITAFSYPYYDILAPVHDVEGIHGNGQNIFKYGDNYYWVYADDGKIKFRESFGGMAWSDEFVISGSLNGCSYPTITVTDDGIPVAVFKQGEDIYYTSRIGSWHEPVKVNIVTPEWAGYPAVTAKNSSEILVAWVDSTYNSAHPELKVAEFQAGENVTSNTTLLPLGTVSDRLSREAMLRPVLLVFNDKFYVFYYCDNIRYYYKDGNGWHYGPYSVTARIPVYSFSTSVTADKISVAWFEYNMTGYNDNRIRARYLYEGNSMSPVETVREDIPVIFTSFWGDTVFMPDIHIFGDGDAIFVVWEGFDWSYYNWLVDAYQAPDSEYAKYPPRAVYLTFKSDGYNWTETHNISPATVGYQRDFSSVFTKSRIQFTSWKYRIQFVSAALPELWSSAGTFTKGTEIIISPASSPLGNESAVMPDVKLMLSSSVLNSFKDMKVKFYLPTETAVSMKVYDPSGRLVFFTQSQKYGAGEHVTHVGESREVSLSSGVYFLRAEIGDRVITRKFMVIR